MTQDEIESFHLSTLKLLYEEAASEYEIRKSTHLGILVANRELPVLLRAKEGLKIQRPAFSAVQLILLGMLILFAVWHIM